MVKSMTEGNPAKLIFLFAIPLIFGNLFQQLYNMADTFIVGQTIGLNALAAVGATGSLTFFIVGFAFGLTSGLAIVTAQRFGANDFEGVRRSFATSIIICLVTTVLLTAISVRMVRPVLQIMQTPENIMDDSEKYLSVIFWGIFASMFFNLFSNMIRALGDSKTPLFVLALVSILNIVLDIVLIVYVKMGVAGAGVATVFSQFVASLVCWFYIRRRLPILHVHKENFTIDRQEYIEHLRVALPMGFQSSIIAIGTIILQFSINKLGTDSVGAYSAANKIDSLGNMPLNSFGATMATYVAQNFGAKKFERIRKGINQCIAMSITASILIAILNISAGRFLVGLFVGAEYTNVIELGETYLIVNACMYWVLALLFIYRYSLQGLGYSFAPTVAGFMELIMRAAGSLILVLPLGFAGVSMANPLAWVGATIPLSIGFYRVLKKMPKENGQVTATIR